MDDSEKLTALKKAYADIILNTAKEAAARIMVSERKSTRFQQELAYTKDEALRMVLRLKQMLDSKVKEAELTSLSQQKKIEELEAQLQEAEEIVRDLRAELRETQAELENVTKKHEAHPPVEQNMKDEIAANGSFLQENRLEPSDATVHSEPDLQFESVSVSDTVCPTVNGIENGSTFCVSRDHANSFYIHNPDFASIVIRRKEPELYRNGCTQRIRALERSIFDGNVSVAGDLDNARDETLAGAHEEDKEATVAANGKANIICENEKPDELEVVKEGADLVKCLPLIKNRRFRKRKTHLSRLHSHRLKETTKESYLSANGKANIICENEKPDELEVVKEGADLVKCLPLIKNRRFRKRKTHLSRLHSDQLKETTKESYLSAAKDSPHVLDDNDTSKVNSSIAHENEARKNLMSHVAEAPTDATATVEQPDKLQVVKAGGDLIKDLVHRKRKRFRIRRTRRSRLHSDLVKEANKESNLTRAKDSDHVLGNNNNDSSTVNSSVAHENEAQKDLMSPFAKAPKDATTAVERLGSHTNTEKGEIFLKGCSSKNKIEDDKESLDKSDLTRQESLSTESIKVPSCTDVVEVAVKTLPLSASHFLSFNPSSLASHFLSFITKMVKRSKKSKSKRVPLKKKYKILKKVKEHNKKKTKEAKKLLQSGKKKVEKDPGIPNDWPFKEQELKALEARREKAIQELEQKKADRKERARKRKLGLPEDDDNSKSVETASLENVATAAKTKVDSSDRAFYKDLVKVIEASDVILEVLDARDPLGTRCVDIEKMVMKAGPEKRLVLLLNKIDLVPRESVEKWLKYLREELPTVAFKCSTQQQRSNLGWKSSKKVKPSNTLQLSDCLGAETLLKLLKNYSRSYEIKKSITVGLVGLPNVGKSSLINSLKRCHVVNVGATPGLTRSMQEIHLDKNVKLLDCPGVVMLKSQGNNATIALKNCKRIEKLEDPIGPVKEILKLCPARVLVALYKIPSFDSVDDFLQIVATVRGKLKKGGIVDIESAARIVLHDWNEGKIPYYTMPPVSEAEPSEAKIVPEFSKDFNIDEVYNGETSFIGTLKSTIDLDPVEVPSSCPLNFDETMLEDNEHVTLPKQDEAPEKVADNDEDESMESDKDDVSKNKGKTASSKQNEKLYTADGILNPKLKRAEKKKKKKANKAGSSDPMDGDYDFKVDYFKKDTMDVEGGSGDDGNDRHDEQVNSEVPMSGVEVDERLG